MKLPAMIKIKQNFQTNPIQDVRGKIRSELAAIELRRIILPGQNVAITAGSRGINNIAEILSSLVDELRKLHAKPFIVAAMGSHGGATADGQREVLTHYGITEKFLGVPVQTSMEVVEVGMSPEGIPVLIDKNAAQADHIVVVNRIKPHTDFEGNIESGLMKMITIGLGKQKAADYYHNCFMDLGHYPLIVSIARTVLKNCRIAFGLGIVENQRDETQIIKAMPADQIEQKERELLVQAKELLPRLPFDSMDILIVDEMGKNYSGTGMDQNVIGRTVVPYHKVPSIPRINRIFVRNLSDESDGNAIGIGNADYTTKQLVDKIDRTSTYMNAITSSCPEMIRIPPYFDSDREVMEVVMETIPAGDPLEKRIVHIKNTLMLEEMYVSEPMQDEIQGLDTIEILGGPFPMKFDESGNMVY